MNAQNMPIAPHASVKHTDAFKACKAFPREATVRVISTHNPWRPGSLGWPLFEAVLRKKTNWTVGEVIDDAVGIGYDAHVAMSNLRWLYTWGDFIEIDGKRYFPEIKEAPVEAPVKKTNAKSRDKSVQKRRKVPA
jgi:hypothetical protein